MAGYPTVIASMVRSKDLQRKLVRPDVDLLGKEIRLLSEWNCVLGESKYVTVDQLRKIAKPQQWLSEKGCLIQRELLVALEDACFKTLVNAYSALSSASWASALPSYFYGTIMFLTVYRCALRYRTGHPVFSSSIACLACKQRVLDAAGDHDSFCQGGERLIRRHKLVRDKFFALAREARLTPRLEVGHLFGDGAMKPANILLPSCNRDHDLCLDVSIVFPFTLLPSITETGEAVRKIEDQKVIKYERHCVSNGLIVCHFVLELTGGFSVRTKEVLDILSVELASVRGVSHAEPLTSIRHQFSFTTQKAMTSGFLIRSNG